ncbi:trihelix transcription factor GT-3b-like [Andrographis paniculata]|uniref:trihelix transcription factor GT-3b-like n=1 Tax=Andrographis paniculata TaxID=175694 RepID=UPI0021E7C643|nr:trihelix transcription factor GT-3b-like [Andrographis paniculata]
MDPGHLHHLHPPPPPYPAAVDAAAGSSADRFPQWSVQETRELLMIRAELDQTFMETKRNKILWEEISTRMREKGYGRSADQCKSKWKNLVTRYKVCETAEAEGMRQQFSHYNELQAIFTARMQRMMWLEAEGGAAKRKTAAALQYSSDMEDQDHQSNEESEVNEKPRKKRKGKAAAAAANPSSSSSSSSNGAMIIINGVREMLEEFTRQQMEVEMQWVRTYEAREEERREKEREWRAAMEVVEKERMTMERKWREREEERKAREEGRAQRRDALITALLNKLTREEHHL